MIAWRGASRYLDEKFKPAFEMELAAMKAVKNDYGLDNLRLMVPFCRTLRRRYWDLSKSMALAPPPEPNCSSW